MNKYQEALRTLMRLFGEDIEPSMSYEHIHKVIYDNLDNLKELIDKRGVDTNESL